MQISILFFDVGGAIWLEFNQISIAMQLEIDGLAFDYSGLIEVVQSFNFSEY